MTTKVLRLNSYDENIIYVDDDGVLVIEIDQCGELVVRTHFKLGMNKKVLLKKVCRVEVIEKNVWVEAK